MLLVLLTAYNAERAIEADALWYSAFLMAFLVIVFAALLNREKPHDDV
jgi:hypothetical protein